MKLSYLGPEGAFSHDAAIELVSRAAVSGSLVPQINVEAVVRSVAGDRDENVIGLVPYYNFLEGLVQEHLDLIYEFSLYIIGAIRLPIALAAGSFEASPGGADHIYSHPKALAQVSTFIQTSLKNVPSLPTASTSDAARTVAKEKRGIAIASENALNKFGVPIFARNIGNIRHGKQNFTDFFVVGRNATSEFGFDLADRSLIAITPHTNRLGLLAELLDEFRFYQLDIAKIHSRPAIDAVEGPDEPQMFYLEVKCAPDAEALHRCAEAIRYRFGGGALSGDPVRVMGGFRI